MSALRRDSSDPVDAARKVALARQTGSPTNRLDVARAVAALDDHAWAAISEFRAGVREAIAENDAESVDFLLRAIQRSLFPPTAADYIDYEAWRKARENNPEVRRQEEAHRADRAEFFRRYQELKAASGLATYREIAAAAGVSVTTVQAIESQTGKPHFRTLKKLAEAFGVDVTELAGPG